MEAKIYDTKGKASGSVTLPEKIFGLPWNADLVHQVANSMRANLRTTIAHTKNRGEVSGGGKKPWKQKGTGRARHGSTRSPIWVGGGIAHGPRNERSFKVDIPRKMRVKALYTVLSKKYKNGEVAFVSDLGITAPKTKEAVAVLNNLKNIPEFGNVLGRANAAHIAVPAYDAAVWKSFRNIGSVRVSPITDLNVLDALQYKNLVIVNPEASIGFLAKKSENKTKKEKANTPKAEKPKIAKTQKTAKKAPAKKTAPKAKK